MALAMPNILCKLLRLVRVMISGLWLARLIASFVVNPSLVLRGLGQAKPGPAKTHRRALEMCSWGSVATAATERSGMSDIMM